MFTQDVQSDSNKRIFIDVTNCNGTIDLQLENDFLREDNTFNNAVGIYFEDANGHIIPNSARCLYTHTNSKWPLEKVTMDVPAGAAALLYWIAPNGADLYDYKRSEVMHIRIQGDVPTLYVPATGVTPPTAAYVNMIHTSNPAHNYSNGIFMVLDNDQRVYMEDFEVGSQVDISILWTRPLTWCEVACAKKHVTEIDVPEPTAAQKDDVERIIPLDGLGGPDESFLSEESQPNLTLQAPGELWVTFVMEGAGYKNKFGYMTLDPEKLAAGAPKNECIIDFVTVWENASALNSGGDLVNGDTVSLGWFPAGTVIGWWLQSNGYNDPNRFYFYSVDEWNGDGFRHVAIGADPYSGKICVGFEDLWNLGDEDYNDLVFYVTGHPISTLDYTTVVVGDPSKDKTSVPVEWTESVINFDSEGKMTFNEELYTERLKGNNGWGNGDQDAPGNSLENNNAENAL